MVRRPTGQLAGQPVGRNRLKGQAFGSVPFAFTKAVVSTTERVASVIAWHSSSPLKLATQARNLALKLAAVPPSVRKASGFPETSKTLRGFASAA